jgi:DNA-binding MarR family transcriptional regulator
MYKKTQVKRRLAVRSPPYLKERSSAARAIRALNALIVQVTRLNGLLIAAGEIMAASANQTHARWQVLATIEHHPASVAEIARALGLARQSVQRVADVLVEKGLAEYRDNPGHRRAQLLRLSIEGADALQEIQMLQELWAHSVSHPIGEEALRRATHTLGRVMQGVEAYDWEG